MNTKEADIAMSVWRCGFIKDKNKIRQAAKEKMRHLIATDLATTLIGHNPGLERETFMKACGF